ncbi:TniQ family protein [Salinimonas iocasae]|nr:TniQ family protein [Salinimonas iocasae]
MTHNRRIPIPTLPKTGESCIGYFDRLAILHGYGGSQELLSILGAKVRSSTLDTYKGQLRAIESLKAVFPLSQRDKLAAHGFEFAESKLFRARGLRVCPECVDENTCHNFRFQTIDVTVCPTHNCLLIDKCHACEKPVASTSTRACVHCGNFLFTQKRSISPSYKQLMTDRRKKGVMFEQLILTVAQFLARPFDFIGAAIDLKKLSCDKAHEVFTVLSYFIYCDSYRRQYKSDYSQKIEAPDFFGKMESAFKQRKFAQLEALLGTHSLLNLYTLEKPSPLKLVKTLEPCLNTAHYERRLPKSMHSPEQWSKALTQQNIVDMLHFELADVKYLQHTNHIKKLHGEVASHSCYHVEELAESLLQAIPQSDKRFLFEIRFSEINSQVLGRFLLSKAELLNSVICGKITSRRVSLEHHDRLQDAIFLDLEALESFVVNHFANTPSKVSMGHLAWLLSMNAEDFKRAHKQSPFIGLHKVKSDLLSADSIPNFFSNYVCVSRLAYLSQIDPYELIGYLNTLNVEKRTLSVNSHLSILYRRTPEVSAVISDLERIGKLKINFAIN